MKKVNTSDYSQKLNDKFDSVWSNLWAEHTVAMEQNLDNYVFDLKANVKILKKNTDNVIKSHKCNQCNFASSHTGDLGRHLKTHSGEKSNKCNQCDFASSQAGDLGRHLKTHSGEKSNKCEQCDFTSFQAGNLRVHQRTHSGEKPYKCNQCDYASSNGSDLGRHLKTHTRGQSGK